MLIVRVLTPGPFEKGLDYIYPFNQVPLAFSRVLVPLGKRKIIGIISEVNPISTIAIEKLKPIIKQLDKIPLLSQNSIDIIIWLAKYYQCTLYQAIKLAIPKLYLQKEYPEISQEISYSLTTIAFSLAKNAHKQRELVELLRHQQLKHSELLAFNITNSALKALVNKNIILKHQHIIASNNTCAKKETPLVLTEHQQKAVDSIHQRLNHFSTTLLYGVTGSGKTEVYIEAIKPIIDNGKQVLVLVPEINLTPQTLTRFQQNFAQPVAAIHSQLTDQARFDLWLKIQNAEINIIIATRSGLLFDMPKLGMIIVDEEHDASYKQQNIPSYQARDVAIFTVLSHHAGSTDRAKVHIGRRH